MGNVGEDRESIDLKPSLSLRSLRSRKRLFQPSATLFMPNFGHGTERRNGDVEFRSMERNREEGREGDTFSRVKTTIMGVIGSAERDVHEAAILDDLGINSLDILELGMALEEEFGVMILDEYLLSSETVGDLVETIHHARPI
ncbi:acyl carrier protein [Martelella sp. FOR1707]